MNYNSVFFPMVMRNPMTNFTSPFTRNYTIFDVINRLGNGIKNFNWKGMLSGVNKTLNVVNQTIPLVKQAKPMYDNVKSMVLLTKAFKKETNCVAKKNNINNNLLINNNNYKKSINKMDTNNNNTDNNPIFFI